MFERKYLAIIIEGWYILAEPFADSLKRHKHHYLICAFGNIYFTACGQFISKHLPDMVTGGMMNVEENKCKSCKEVIDDYIFEAIEHAEKHPGL